MKSKKPFLIVCAAALSLAVALPFMGVFAFADNSTFRVTFSNPRSGFVSIFLSPGGTSGGDVIQGSSSLSFNLSVDTLYTAYFMDGSGNYQLMSSVGGSTSEVSRSSAAPTVFSSDNLPSFSVGSSVGSSVRYYFKIELPPPPDPLSPVSDGMDTMISVFGDVIDYIINTPDVAIFVAISVASCAIIPMGIILIKKLIKGY